MHLVTNKTNIRYLSGFSGSAGYLLVQGRKGFLLTDSRYHLVAKTVLPGGFRLVDSTAGVEKILPVLLRKLRVRRLHFEGGEVSVRFYHRLKKMLPEVSLMDCGDEISRRRMVKKSFELKHIARAQRITDEIFSEMRAWLRPGVSEKEIAWRIESAAHEKGAEGISFPPIIGINEHSASPHHQNTERKMRRGDIVLIDMGVMYKGYCSDMTRVLFSKKPTSEQAQVYDLVWRAQETAIKKLRAGISGAQADFYARSLIEKAGYGKNFGHSLGHGVGLDIHELPNLAHSFTEKIPAGAVVTVEPGVYLPGKFGVRLEDMLLVKKPGSSNFTKSPKDLKECIINL